MVSLVYYSLTHCMLVDSAIVICWASPFVIEGVSGLFCQLYPFLYGKSRLANNEDPDQTPLHFMWRLYLGQHCLPMTLLRVSR